MIHCQFSTVHCQLKAGIYACFLFRVFMRLYSGFFLSIFDLFKKRLLQQVIDELV